MKVNKKIILFILVNYQYTTSTKLKGGMDQAGQSNKPVITTDEELNFETDTMQVFSVTDIHSYSLEDIEYSDSEGSDEEELMKAEEKSEVTVTTEESKSTKEQWAFMIDITKPVNDFHKKIPDMAHKWRIASITMMMTMTVAHSLHHDDDDDDSDV
ncbi:hypothetical protein QZH41_004436 [Actinostola sp. cb2023]|nr:hypothetical protein QZH41_004436 [Actinostola sp. cb2023]